jgi:translocation and assembly module TamB
MADPSSPTPPTPARPRPRWVTSLTIVLVPALLLVVALLAAGWWLASSSGGLRAAAYLATWALPSLKTSGLTGSLREGFTAERIEIDEPGWSLTVEEFGIQPNRLSWSERVVDLARVSARLAAVRWTPGDDTTPSEPPQSLRLPVELRIGELSVGELQLGERKSDPFVLREVALSGSAGRDTIRIQNAQARRDDTRLVLAGELGTASPFPLRAGGEISSQMLERALQADIGVSGSLLDAAIVLRSDSDNARARVTGRATPFAPVPLASLSVDIADFDPSSWLKDAPVMRLTASAELKPRQEASGLVLSGPFSVDNALAGPIDRQRVPLDSARGSLVWTAEQLRLSFDRVTGASGSAEGRFQWQSSGPLSIDASFTGVDAARIHSSLTATRANGTLAYTSEADVQRFQGRMTNTKGVALSAEFDASIARQVLEIETLVARLGEGRAEVSGTIELAGRTAARLRGRFERLDLSQLVTGLDTRLNGRFEVDGRLQPQRDGRLQLALSDSRLYGRSLEGRADAKIAGERIDVDADFRSGEAQLKAAGGLGSGREIIFALRAPQLSELMSGLQGSVTASGTVGGTLDSPSVQAKASANGLVLPNQHRIEAVEASVQTAARPDAPLGVELTVTGYRVPDQPELSLTQATLSAEGTTAAHVIRLDGTTGANASLLLRAKSSIKEGAWQGIVTSAAAGAPFNFQLAQPTEIVVAADRMAIGPTAFTARDTAFSEVRLARRHGQWQTSGVFEHLQPQALDSRARAPRRAVRTATATPVPLTLAGRWDLLMAEAVNGIFVIERTGGDLYGGVDAVHAIGISDVGAALSIVDSRVTGTAYLRGKSLGKVDAVIDAYVDPEALALAQYRRFRISIDAELPDLGWTGPLISDGVQIQGAASVAAVIGGTPAEPTAEGTLRGRELRVSWIEQGLRLENGTLNAKLEDGVLIIDEAVFTGDPRVRPDEKRAMAAVSFETHGTVRAVGRIAVQTLTGSIGVKADRLPILQRRDRWMAVTGEAGITLTPTRAEFYAKTTVDGAYIDFSALRGPRTLPDDVIVVRADQPKTRKEAAGPVDVVLDVEARLGQRFYIRGAGLEARLGGRVAVTGRPGQLHAEGTVRIIDGIYNGYGQRLQIERGLVTFQGPLENPSLNVLAVRGGLPVEVGVQISGTALNPLISLHSDVAMPDIEKLNWLVLGRPAGAGDGQDRALLTAAATALFASRADGKSDNVLRSLGIDEFGIRSGQTGTSLLPRESVAGTLRSSSGTAVGDFVAVGKRLTDDLSITFEQAISGAAYYVALNYQLTRRISLVGRVGSTTALDLVYSIAFD